MARTSDAHGSGRDWLAAIALVAVGCAVSILVSPQGNFPVNDDWAYARSVQWFLAEGRVRIPDWAAMNLLPQVLLGSAASSWFGFSFEALRHTTQVVAALASLAIYGWFRACRLRRGDSFVASLAVLSCALWPVLANSFMTDLYAMLFAMASSALFVRYLSTRSGTVLVLATVMAAIGMLQRQVVLVVPLAFAIAIVVSRPRTPRNIAVAAIALLAVIGAELLYSAYLLAGPGMPLAQQATYGQLMQALVDTFTNEGGHRFKVLMNAVNIAGYLGLFASPWALWSFSSMALRSRAVVLVLWVLFVVASFAAEWFPPYRLNMILDRAGIGPFTLFDAYFNGTSLAREPGLLWRSAAIAAGFGLAVLAVRVGIAFARMCQGKLEPRHVFCLVAAGAYLGPFVVTDFYDRYLVFILPFLFVLMYEGGETQPVLDASRISAVALSCTLALLGIIGTHDYFAWNRARWKAIDAAQAMGATPDTMDGGFEYNGYFHPNEAVREPPAGRSWWWVEDDEWIVAFIDVAGYDEVGRFPVDRWWRRTPPVVRLLHRHRT